LKINTRQTGRITILDLDGPLRLGPAEDVFRSQAEQLILAGSTLLAVNLARVSDLDSSGVGARWFVYSRPPGALEANAFSFLQASAL
jgi:ABC-type transporter Mla MlaB component